MSDPRVVYALTIIEDLYGTGRQHKAYHVQLGRRGSPADMAAELRMAADALEGHFAEAAIES